MNSLSVKRRLTCILAADAVGYSSLMGQDEEGTIRVLAAHRAVIDGIITFHEGRIIGTAGDSVVAEFSSVVEAVRCAVEIQEALKTRNDSLSESRQMLFRVGVNLGDVVVKNDDLLGDGINVAARLETIAEPGGICISSSVYDQIAGKLDLGFQDIGEQSLKNISRPIRVYRLTGSVSPARPAPPAPAASPALPARKAALWVIGAVGVAALAAAVAWQAGWLRSGASEGGSATKAVAPALAPQPVPVAEKSAPAGAAADANATRAQAEADAQRLRSEAEALKRQAETELARTRADADAARAARTKAGAEAAAALVRTQAEADAARIRAEAQAQMAKAVEAQREADASAKAVASTARPAAAPTPDKTARAAEGAQNTAFDGVWSVTIVCQVSSDGAQGYTLEFVAQVKDGYLRGQRSTEGSADSLRLEGQIQPDGNATLDAKGLTGDPRYSMKRVQKGSAYTYRAAARFEGSRGTGSRLGARACDLRFVKQ